MANEVKVNWIQVTGFVLNPGGNGLSNANFNPVPVDNEGRSVLDFGNVQAGKVTKLRCVVARFSGASQVSDLQFWLDNTTANAQGSTNVDLSKWEFYYCIVPRDKLNFNIETTITEEQKKGQASLAGDFYMKIIDRKVDEVPIDQFPPLSGVENQNESLVLNITGDYADSHLIMLAVQTPTDANSGNTAGWFYRMNFLYS